MWSSSKSSKLIYCRANIWLILQQSYFHVVFFHFNSEPYLSFTFWTTFSVIYISLFFLFSLPSQINRILYNLVSPLLCLSVVLSHTLRPNWHYALSLSFLCLPHASQILFFLTRLSSVEIKHENKVELLEDQENK